MFKSLTIAALAAAILAAGLSSASAALGDNGKDVNGCSGNGLQAQVTGAGSASMIVLALELAPTQQ